MKTSELVFVGIKGSVVALNRATGEQVWATHLKGSEFVNVIVQGRSVLAACRGEIFSLDPLNGNPLWHNPLTGFGMGLAGIAIDNGGTGTGGTLAAEAARRAAASAAAAAAST